MQHLYEIFYPSTFLQSLTNSLTDHMALCTARDQQHETASKLQSIKGSVINSWPLLYSSNDLKKDQPTLPCPAAFKHTLCICPEKTWPRTKEKAALKTSIQAKNSGEAKSLNTKAAMNPLPSFRSSFQVLMGRGQCASLTMHMLPTASELNRIIFVLKTRTQSLTVLRENNSGKDKSAKIPLFNTEERSLETHRHNIRLSLLQMIFIMLSLYIFPAINACSHLVHEQKPSN